MITFMTTTCVTHCRPLAQKRNNHIVWNSIIEMENHLQAVTLVILSVQILLFNIILFKNKLNFNIANGVKIDMETSVH